MVPAPFGEQYSTIRIAKMGGRSIKSHLTITRRMNFMIGYFINVCDIVIALLQLQGPETQVMVDYLQEQKDCAFQMLDLAKEKYEIVELPNGNKVALFKWCNLQMPLEQLESLTWVPEETNNEG